MNSITEAIARMNITTPVILPIAPLMVQGSEFRVQSSGFRGCVFFRPGTRNQKPGTTNLPV
jgi:hypothetical protein